MVSKTKSVAKVMGSRQHRGGTAIGFIVGVVFGLAAALAVAVYVTKVPIPFISKSQSNSAEQDANEAKKNKDWDPNAPLYGKTPVRPVTPATGGASAPVLVPGAMPGVAVPVVPKPEAKAPVRSDDPLGDLARAKAGGGPAEPFVYFVQAGAFRTPEDAEAQRAKVSFSGIEAKVSEREQAGRPVFRVRAGPFERKADADQAKEKLDGAGFDTAIVRVQR